MAGFEGLKNKVVIITGILGHKILTFRLKIYFFEGNHFADYFTPPFCVHKYFFEIIPFLNFPWSTYFLCLYK
jgi:hypothetical protein